MKRFLTVLILLVTTISFAQEKDNTTNGFIGFSIDPAQLVEGEPKGFQWVAEVGVQDKFSRVALFYERFDEIEYVSYGLQPSLILPLFSTVDLGLGTEVSIIRRPARNASFFTRGDEYSSYASYAFNGSVSVKVVDRLSLFVKADMKRRPDIDKLWQFSGYTGVRVSFL
jgi:hypothetical protein